MKKTSIKLFLIPLGLFVLSSCVSSRKYKESQKESNNYKDQASAMETKYMRLQHTNDSLKLQLASIRKTSDEKFQVTDLELQISEQPSPFVFLLHRVLEEDKCAV